MKMPEELAVMLREKLSKDLGYWARQYEAAVERIEDHTANEDNPYWFSKAESASAPADEAVLLDEYGGEERAGDAILRAFEILVLADLAGMRLHLPVSAEGVATEEALSRTVTELREAYQALAIGRDSESDENARLRAALVEAREAIAAVHHAGFDSTRQQLATAGVRGITAALGQEQKP